MTHPLAVIRARSVVRYCQQCGVRIIGRRHFETCSQLCEEAQAAARKP